MSAVRRPQTPGPPLQERSKHTLAAIVRGTLAALRSDDFDSLTMTDVARNAGVSVGTIYTRFADKEALLNYVISELLREQVQPFRELFRSERWVDVGLAQRTYHMIRALVHFAHNQPGLQRAIATRQVRRHGMLTAEDRHHRTQVRDAAASWLLECTDEIGVSDPAAAVAFAVETIFARIQHWILMRSDADRPDPAVLADELTRMTLAYLSAPIELPDPTPIATPYGPVGVPNSESEATDG